MTDSRYPIDELMRVLDYNPETGIFTWKVRPIRNSRVRPGDIAGREVRSKGTEKTAYWYICYDNRQFNASMVAWAFTYGEWPNRKLRFLDGNGLNARISNLKLDERFNIYGEGRKANQKSYKRHSELVRNHDVKYRYGLSPEHLREMIKDQNGCCAICEKPERVMINGKVKPLSVDHCHATGKVRQLLCSHCNHALGHMCDDPTLLRKAADYLEKHQRLAEAPLPDNVIKLKEAR